jgi:Na+-driven multidrug efflux pump
MWMNLFSILISFNLGNGTHFKERFFIIMKWVTILCIIIQIVIYCRNATILKCMFASLKRKAVSCFVHNRYDKNEEKEKKWWKNWRRMNKTCIWLMTRNLSYGFLFYTYANFYFFPYSHRSPPFISFFSWTDWCAL